MAITHEVMTAEQLRAAERATMLHTSESTLMDNAAAAIAVHCPAAATVAVLAGRGNNGGDALLAGALLAQAGAKVTAVLLSPDAHGRGLAHLTTAGGRAVNWADARGEAEQAIGEAALVIDGIVGLGGQSGLRAPAQAAVAHITPGTYVVAVDLPSGLDPDSAEANKPHVVADLTVTFTAPKACLIREPAAASAGRVVIANVGVAL